MRFMSEGKGSIRIDTDRMHVMLSISRCTQIEQLTQVRDACACDDASQWMTHADAFTDDSKHGGT